MLLKPKRTNRCAGLEARLEDYLESRLESREIPELDSHLRSCPRCDAALAAALTSRELFATLPVPAAMASPGFVARVMGAIAGERRRLESWKPVEVAAWRFCWAAAAAVLLLAVVLVKVRMSAPPIPASQPSQVQTLVSVPLPQPVGTDDTVLLVAREEDAR